jgi:hypothetical protein
VKTFPTNAPPQASGANTSLVRRSGVTGCFLDELYARAQAQFGVDVGQVGLHAARRHEKPCGDVVVGQPFADQPYDVALGGGERCPPAGGPFAFAAAALRVRDRFLGRTGLRPRPTRSQSLCRPTCLAAPLPRLGSRRRRPSSGPRRCDAAPRLRPQAPTSRWCSGCSGIARRP